MNQYKEKFDTKMGVKTEANAHEIYLYDRAKLYIKKISWIPGLQMIAIVNSLSMNATHNESDIDLFIVTKPKMIWFVRFFMTLFFWKWGVWRKNSDIRENFCLSFFITTEALNLSKIAIENDIYLYYWIYYMKPILIKDNSYTAFLKKNQWVDLDLSQQEINTQYTISGYAFPIFEHIFFRSIFLFLNTIISFFGKKQTLKTYHNLGKPKGICISDTMLKFHNLDKRWSIRDQIVEKNFDK